MKQLRDLSMLRRSQVDALLTAEGTNTQKVGRALDRWQQGKFANDEFAAVQAIEMQRYELSSRTDSLPFPDYSVSAPAVNLTRTIGEICRTTSKSPEWATLLFLLVRELTPLSALELGTSLGITAAYQSSALKLNHSGRLLTLDGAPASVAIAQELFETLALERVDTLVGLFDDTLSEAIQMMAPIDYAFIDGHHDEWATQRYFNQLLPALSPSATIVFDDIRWSPGMIAAWNRIKQEPRITTIIDLGPIGICIVSDNQSQHLAIERDSILWRLSQTGLARTTRRQLARICA